MRDHGVDKVISFTMRVIIEKIDINPSCAKVFGTHTFYEGGGGGGREG